MGGVVWDLDLYLFDGFAEGYVLDERKKFVTDFIGSLRVHESIFMFVSGGKVQVEDIGSVALDKMKRSQMLVYLGKDGWLRRWWDFAIVGDDGFKMSDVRRLATGARNVAGVDVLALWLSQYRTRSFGQKQGSRVVKEIFDEVVSEYAKLGVDFNVEYNIDDSRDVERYVQVNCSSLRFLSFLRNSSRGDGLVDSYLCWIDRFVESGKKFVRLNFKRISELKKQSVKYVFEYVTDPKKLEEAVLSGEGVIEDNIIPVLSFYLDSRNEGLVVNRRQFEMVEFDFERLSMRKKLVKVFDREEKNVIKSFFDAVAKKEYVVKGVANGVVDELMRFISAVNRAGLKKRIWVLCYGVPGLRLGDKVRLILPTGFKTELIEALSGDWIVGSIVHVYSGSDYQWLMKVGLMGVDYKV